MPQEAIQVPALAPARQVRIELAERSYDILIGVALLDSAHCYVDLPRASTALIVSNTQVAPLYAARLQAALASAYAKVLLVTLPDGEAHKDWPTLQLIFDALLQNSCDRKTVLFALGGGVVGDMAGFAAASYMRGVPFVQIPTTLLAQVDSSVGGKTAINHPLGKNMIGAFYQPQRVICDLDLLKTLPARELSAGLAEIIKYGPIADMDFFSWIESHIDALLGADSSALAHAVQRLQDFQRQLEFGAGTGASARRTFEQRRYVRGECRPQQHDDPGDVNPDQQNRQRGKSAVDQ